jgi:cephalosporin hydroxylase
VSEIRRHTLGQPWAKSIFLESMMPGLQGLMTNLRVAVSSPRAWWLARKSVVRYGAIQRIEELTEFTRMILAQPPSTVLEIGTAQGGVFWLLCRVSASDATLISLDLPPDNRGSGGLRLLTDLQPMKQPGQTIHEVLGNSHDTQTHDRVKTLLDGRKLDLLFIDGDHTYAGVRHDYETYRSLVRPGGLIAFHDIVPTQWPECQVDRFWGEVAMDQSLHPRAIVGRTPSHFGGIGVVTPR